MNHLETLDEDLVRKAVYFATKAHCNAINEKTGKIGQIRKGTEDENGVGIPYIVHPFEVWAILKENGCSTNVQVAGLLHDTLEDTGVTPEQIEKEFGPEILALVQTESEDKSKSWEERKGTTLAKLANAHDETKLVCLADKLSNVRSMAYDLRLVGEKLWSRFNRPKENLAWYYRGIAEALKSMSYMKIYKDYVQTVEEVFGK